jgi:hypothetical protein
MDVERIYDLRIPDLRASRGTPRTFPLVAILDVSLHRRDIGSVVPVTLARPCPRYLVSLPPEATNGSDLDQSERRTAVRTARP